MLSMQNLSLHRTLLALLMPRAGHGPGWAYCLDRVLVLSKDKNDSP